MKRSTKITSIIIIFFLIIATVIVGRTMIGNHFKKKFSKRPPPGIIVTAAENRVFENLISTYGTARPFKTQSYKIEKYEILKPINFNQKVKKGDVIAELKNRKITAQFDGIIGKRGLSEDVLGSENLIILTLDDSSIIFCDLKIPETFATAIKKGLPIEAKFSGYKNKIYNGEVDTVSSRINADTRSLLTRIKIENKNFELIPGSLLEVTVKYNERNSLSVPDTSIMLEGNKAYVYKVSTENITNRAEIIIGSRSKGNVEVLSGLVEGDLIVAEGLKKVRPRGQIKPIKK